MQTGPSDPDQLTFWSAELPAKASASQDSAKVCPTPEADSCLPILRSLNVCGLDGLSGKMSPVSCHQDQDGILVPSSGRWGNWGMGGPTGSWTLNGCEHNGIPTPSRSAGDVCSLSDVLETGTLPDGYYLSRRACEGILRRAKKRGKALPPLLQTALERAVQTTTRHQQDI